MQVQALTVNWVGDCISETADGDMDFVDVEHMSNDHSLLFNIWSGCDEIIKEVSPALNAYAHRRDNHNIIDVEVKLWASGDDDLKSLDRIMNPYGFNRVEKASRPFDIVKEKKVEKRLFTYTLSAGELTAMQLAGSCRYAIGELLDKGLEERIVDLYSTDA